MTITASTLFVILAMAAATLLTRYGGLVLVRYLEPKGATRRMLEAVPPAVLTAVVAPTALATGIAETIASLATIFAARRLSLLPSVTIGIACVALLRAVGI